MAHHIFDCFKYYKGCEECQRFGDLQLVPAALIHPIIKSWPFRGWGSDFIGQINPPSSKGHHFVLVATDYFTKWTETVPLNNMTQKEVIEFITEHIIHRFGIPQTLTTDQGSSFISKEVRAFAESYKIKLLNSSPYYAQETVLPVEVNLNVYRLAKQNDLSTVGYHDLMMDNIDEVTDKRLKALKEIEKDNLRVAKAYNKKVKFKSFRLEIWFGR